MSKFRVVLFEPEIPSNTGNIGRTCLGMQSELHLIRPLGFEIDHKKVKRAGLDYWPKVSLFFHESFEHWLKSVTDLRRVFFFTTKTKRTLYDIKFQYGDWLVFGPETRGLPYEILSRYERQLVTLPQSQKIRSYNLASAVSMALTESTRQTYF